MLCFSLRKGKSDCCIVIMAESPITFFKAYDTDILFLPLITIKGLCLIIMAEVGRRNRFDFVSFYFIMTNYYSIKII